MKFQVYLEKNKINAWKEFYINYNLLKKIMKPMQSLYKTTLISTYRRKVNKTHQHQQLPYSVSSTNLIEPLIDPPTETDINSIDLSKIQNQFITQLLLELKKVEFFYLETLYNRIKVRFDQIKAQIEHCHQEKEFKLYEDIFEMSIKELYREACLLKEFLDLNIKAKTKIVKKYKKVTKQLVILNKANIENVINDFIQQSELKEYEHEVLSTLDDCNKMFVEHFRSKYQSDTAKVLKKYYHRNMFTMMQSFNFGLFVGIIILQVITIFLIAYNFDIDMDRDLEFKSVFPMFRSLTIICLYMWIFGITVWGWENYNIDYKVIFQLSNQYSSLISICKRAAVFTFVLLAIVLIYIIDRTEIPFLFDVFAYVPMHILPLICWLGLIGYIFFPFRGWFNYEGRTYYLTLFMQSVGSIFVKTDFRHVWFMEQIISFIGPMRDFEYTLCYYTHYNAPLENKIKWCSHSGYISLVIGFIPNILRILQCIRLMIDVKETNFQIINIGKYIINLIVITFSFYWYRGFSFRYLWFGLICFGALYSFIWDIVYEFGLLHNGNGYPLREKLCYPSKVFYYFVVTIDLLLRFSWFVILSPEVLHFLYRPEIVGFILFLLEIIRRGMWNAIRVEYKHIEIFKEYRVTSDIQLPYPSVFYEYFNLNDDNDSDKELNEEEVIQNNQKSKIRYESRVIQDVLPTKRDKGNAKEKCHENKLVNYLANDYYPKSKNNLNRDKELMQILSKDS